MAASAIMWDTQAYKLLYHARTQRLGPGSGEFVGAFQDGIAASVFSYAMCCRKPETNGAPFWSKLVFVM